MRVLGATVACFVLLTGSLFPQSPPTADVATVRPHFRWSERLAHELDYNHTISKAKELTVEERRGLLAFMFHRFKHPISKHDEEMFEGMADRELRQLASNARIEFVDLDGDGKNEILVQGNGVGACGVTGNCVVIVLRSSSTGYEALLDSRAGVYGGGYEKIRVLESVTNGFRDIVLASHDSAAERSLSVYRYSKGKYRIAECYDLDWNCYDCSPPRVLDSPRITLSNQCR